MTKFIAHRVTNREMHILTIVYKFRGLTIEQLVRQLCLELNRPYSKTIKYNTYKILNSLDKSRYIITETIRLHRAMDFIYLTELGIEKVAEHLGIMPLHTGSGWNEDYGDFPFPLQKPPRNLHHVLLTEALLELEKLKVQHRHWQLDYRDNRYCAQLYDWQGEQYVFRPDAALRIGEKIFFVEIDRGTEFIEKLKEKFEGYHRYFSYLKQNKKPIPYGVVFVSDKENKNDFNRRWALIKQAFYSEMGQWYTVFNLMACKEISDIKNLIVRQITRNDVFQDFSKKINYYTHHDNIKFGKHDLGWSDAAAAIVQTDTGQRYYAFERVEEFETIGLCRLYEFGKKFGNGIKEYIPILFYTGGAILRHVFRGFEDEELITTLQENLIWLNIKKEPLWFDKNGNRINTGNPLLSMAKLTC
ncbi:replication-relaxation family protein [Marinicrinis lubricantis]|uniref:Replication-relaxation family protein n=1 Tax=Marinicrinis lubricantis TaxID=2086470 RepID=A0ABW1IPM3_9BACL